MTISSGNGVVGLQIITFLPVDRGRCRHLTALDKMAAISQVIVSDAFLWMKSIVFWFKFKI